MACGYFGVPEPAELLPMAALVAGPLPMAAPDVPLMLLCGMLLFDMPAPMLPLLFMPPEGMVFCDCCMFSCLVVSASLASILDSLIAI